MCISAKDGIELVAALWADEYHLVRRYFGKYLAKLVRADQNGIRDIHFAKVALRPCLLEARLQRIDPLGQTERIMAEVGNIDDPERLDKRLQDAWAELRVIDQLSREGFSSIQKVEEIADFVAQSEGSASAFQVTRINKHWSTQVADHCESGTSLSRIALGDIGDIYRRLSGSLDKRLLSKDETDQCDDDFGPLSHYFWDAIARKNSDFKRWTNRDQKRCIVIVSNEEALQDSMVRHIACRLIREALHSWLVSINFEELLWLPDAGNGAWFRIGSTIKETRCFADWSDALDSDIAIVSRKEVDLDSVLPAWKA